MKWLKDILSDAKAILSAPLTNILCAAGTISIIVSFVKYDKTQGLALHGNVNWPIAVLGFTLVVIGVVVFLLTQREKKAHTQLDYQKGVEVKRGELQILIQTGEIQRIQGLTSNSAIILPANTTFIDDCVADKRTAMSAFFGEYFPAEIGNLPSLFKQVLYSAS